MEHNDDPQLKRIQEMLEHEGGGVPEERLKELLGNPPRLMSPASAIGTDKRSRADHEREFNKGLLEMVERARRVSSAVTAVTSAAQSETTTQLKKLKSEANLTWDTIARESGVSRRWLLQISAGAEPGSETAKSLGDYFSRILKRPVQF